MRCAEKKDVKQGKVKSLNVKHEKVESKVMKNSQLKFGPQITLEWARPTTPTTDVKVCTLTEKIFLNLLTIKTLLN